MTDFRAKPLGALDAIYRFVGGLRGVGAADLHSPIQLVHDVSYQAARGSGIVAIVSTTVTTGGAGADAFNTISLADFFDGTISTRLTQTLDALGRTKDDTDGYLTELGVVITQASSANLASVAATMYGPQTTKVVSTPNQVERHLLVGNAITGIGHATSGGPFPVIYSDPTTAQHNAALFKAVEYPARFHQLNYRTTDGGAGAVVATWTAVTQLVPQGTQP